MSDATTGYLIDIRGLAEAIARSEPGPAHQPLLRCPRSFEPLASVPLGTRRGDAYLVKRKVLDAQGRVVTEDHEAWLREQLEADGGRASSTYERLKGAGYVLSKCAITTLYLVHDRCTSDESNFVQAEVDLEDEWTDCALFTRWPHREAFKSCWTCRARNCRRTSASACASRPIGCAASWTSRLS